MRIGPCWAAGLSLFGGVADEGDPDADVVLAPLGHADRRDPPATARHEAALAALRHPRVRGRRGRSRDRFERRGHARRAKPHGRWLGSAILRRPGQRAVRHRDLGDPRRDPVVGGDRGVPCRCSNVSVREHFGSRSWWDLVGLFHGSGVRREQRRRHSAGSSAADAPDDPAIAARFERGWLRPGVARRRGAQRPCSLLPPRPTSRCPAASGRPAPSSRRRSVDRVRAAYPERQVPPPVSARPPWALRGASSTNRRPRDRK